jgi:phage-related protein
MWVYEFYSDDDGYEPVKEFICSLDEKKRGKVLQMIQILSEFGPNLPFPYSSQIEGKLRELRIHYGKSQLRIIYYLNSEGVFILLHAFEKKSQKISNNDIRIARERMKNDLNKRGGR